MSLNGRKAKANQTELFIYLSGNSLIFSGGGVLMENGISELPQGIGAWKLSHEFSI